MIQFSEDMKIGVPHIDLQHKSMFDFVNKTSLLCVESPDREKVEECLNFLGYYVLKHFSDEEKLQMDCKYPRYEQHKKIHQEFTDLFDSLYKEFQKHGPSKKLSLILANGVINWIATHIKKEDMVFGEYYINIKLSALKRYVSG